MKKPLYELLAAALICLAGLGLCYQVAIGWLNDIRFYACAKRTPVFVDSVRFDVKLMSDAISPDVTSQLTSVLVVRSGGRQWTVTEYFGKGGAAGVAGHKRVLQGMAGRDTHLYLCEAQPDRFEFESAFPWGGAMVLLGGLMVFVFPAGVFIIYIFSGVR